MRHLLSPPRSVPIPLAAPLWGASRGAESDDALGTCDQCLITSEDPIARLNDLDAPHKGAAKGDLTPQCGGGEVEYVQWTYLTLRKVNSDYPLMRCSRHIAG